MPDIFPNQNLSPFLPRGLPTATDHLFFGLSVPMIEIVYVGTYGRTHTLILLIVYAAQFYFLSVLTEYRIMLFYMR